jgi:hypothetical protein
LLANRFYFCTDGIQLCTFRVETEFFLIFQEGNKVKVDAYVTVIAFLCRDQETVVAIEKSLCLRTYLYCTFIRRHVK